jgi:hypothetical protein
MWIMRSWRFVFLVTFIFVSYLYGQKTAKSQTASASDVAQARSLHEQLVIDLSGGQSPNSKLSMKIQSSYPSDLTTWREANGKNGIPVLTYREAIVRTEDVMKQAGLKVKVMIHASPHSCSVKYKPVFGGAELDAGQTDLSTELEPRWYIFSCDCAKPPIEQRVDCTNNKTIQFQCN